MLPFLDFRQMDEIVTSGAMSLPSHPRSKPVLASLGGAGEVCTPARLGCGCRSWLAASFQSLQDQMVGQSTLLQMAKLHHAKAISNLRCNHFAIDMSCLP